MFVFKNMQTEFQEQDKSIGTRDHIFLNTKSICSCSTLNTAEYQVPQSHGLVRKREMCVGIRTCSSLINRRHCQIRFARGLENLLSH